LKNEGVIEIVGRGRGTRYILSKRFYTFIGERGVYTRKKGLDTEEKKALIIKHLKEHGEGTIGEFEQVLPSLSRNQIHGLLRNLRNEGKVKAMGRSKGAYWVLK
jgi:ATP-dependent DNA helicase RecG